MAKVKSMPSFQMKNSFPVLEKAKTPIFARYFARFLLALFAFMPFFLMFVPWQQTVKGRGQVIAFAPVERKQKIESQITGIIKRWHVVEGSYVKSGDPIVDIEDVDPSLATRLEAQRNFLLSRRQAAQAEVVEQSKAVSAQEKAMEASVKAAESKRDASAMMITVAQKARENTQFNSQFETKRFQMFDTLFKDKQFGGLESELNRDEAKLRADRAETEVKRAMADVKKSEADLLNSDSLVIQAEASGLSVVALARRDLNRAEQNLLTIERDMQELDSRIERFKARFVKATCDGILYRIAANVADGGQLVKEGDELATIIPEATDRVVELFIDGVDAPLISAHMEKTGRGPHVRLQFQGWPAIQFAGWPSIATGTFGGKVRQIDPSDDGYGRFRILIEPERLMGEEDEWPDTIYLRQGNQAVGWVFLNKVTVGYELWRNFNGFPPVVAPKAPEKDKDKKDSKPPKIKT